MEIKNNLQKEIADIRKEIYTDAYSMSIGEWANLYRDGELDIHPEFQRIFRWTPTQKTKLIESVMLDIPIPSVFVSQNSDTGIWDVVDGVQRLSTFFEFMGLLKDEDDNFIEPFTLEKTKYLPSFEGVTWKKQSKSKGFFTKEMQLDFKRYRIDVKIVKKESDPSKKYELFQRLNTGGTKLSDQEVRNCLMVMTNSKVYSLFVELSNDINFQKCTPISERKEDEQFRLELISRYMVAKSKNIDNLAKEYNDLAELLNEEIIKICNDKEFDFKTERSLFKKTSKILSDCLGENAFKAYRHDKFQGAVLSAAFLTVMVGVSQNINEISTDFLKDKAQKLYEQETYKKNTANGVRATDRFVALSKFGCEYFKS